MALVYKRKFLIFCFVIIFIVISVVFVSRVFSYDTNIAHPFLTKQAIELFNKNSDSKISEQEIKWIIQGAVEEDTPIRWMNHFFEPAANKGLTGFSTAKEWSKENIKQKAYAKGNQTWQKAIESYGKGDKKEAFIALGHNLHLIEDMSVPAHTRIDAHPEGDPYEEWSKKNINANFTQESIAKFKNLDEYFNLLASYSNRYFLSADTIKQNELLKKERFFKKINETEAIECIKGELEFRKFCLAVVKKDLTKENYILDDFVHSDYYSLLAPKTISYSAGVIELFFKEAEKENKNILLNKNKKNGMKDIFIDSWQNIVESYENLPLNISSQFVDVANEEILFLTKAGDAGGKVLSAIENPISIEDLFAPQKAKSAEDNGAFAGQPEQEKVEVLSSEYKFTNKETKSPIGDLVSAIGISYVIDGDTIVLTTGEKIRYIGIDTPELNNDGAQDDECLAWAARLRNMELLGKGELKLVKDSAVDKDKYGRLLRYVYAGDMFINEQLAREGLAEMFFCPATAGENCPATADKDKEKIIVGAGDEAKQNKRGLFSGICEQKKLKNESESENKKTEEKAGVENPALQINNSGQFSPFVFGIGSPPPTLPQQRAEQSPQEEEQQAGGGEEQTAGQDEQGEEGEQEEGEDEEQQDNEAEEDEQQDEQGEEVEEETEETSPPTPPDAASPSIVLDTTESPEIVETAANHVVISEIYINEINPGSEWIELYNPTGQDIFLDGWTIDTKSDDAADITLPTEAKILPFGYYFIGDNANGAWNPDNADWPVPDHTETMTLTDSDGWARLKNINGENIDIAGWGGALFYETAPVDITNYSQGKSIERKAVAVSIAETMASGGEHQSSGNGYDSDDNSQDFTVRDIPEPQNSHSPAEPRARAVIIPDTIEDLGIEHIFTTNNSIRLFWTSPENANLGEGARYDLRYQEKSGDCDLQINWDSAAAVAISSLPAPADFAGQEQTAEISGLSAGTEYCFAVRTYNGEAWSAISNQISAKTKNIFSTLGMARPKGDLNGHFITQTLTVDKSPYYFGGAVSLKKNNVLTIEPGVVIKFGGEYFNQWYMYPVVFHISGRIIAQGTEANPIVFTSIYDDSYCGDSNGDGAATAPEPGSWGGWKISSGNNIFDYVIMKYGGDNRRDLFSFYNKEGVNQITNSVFIDNLNDSRFCSASSTKSLIVDNNFCYHNE